MKENVQAPCSYKHTHTHTRISHKERKFDILFSRQYGTGALRTAYPGFVVRPLEPQINV